MFICQVTGKVSEAGEKMNRIIAKTKPKVYTRREFDPEINEWVDVFVGRGFEIVKEIQATEEGVVEWQQMTDAQREEHLKHVDYLRLS